MQWIASKGLCEAARAEREDLVARCRNRDLLGRLAVKLCGVFGVGGLRRAGEVDVVKRWVGKEGAVGTWMPQSLDLIDRDSAYDY